MAHRVRCSVACGIFPDWGSNPCPLHWQADSQPLDHQGRPSNEMFDGSALDSALSLQSCGVTDPSLSNGWGKPRQRGQEIHGLGEPRGVS